MLNANGSLNLDQNIMSGLARNYWLRPSIPMISEVSFPLGRSRSWAIFFSEIVVDIGLLSIKVLYRKIGVCIVTRSPQLNQRNGDHIACESTVTVFSTRAQTCFKEQI